MHVLSELYADSVRKVDPHLIKRTRTPLTVFLCYWRNDDNRTNQNGTSPIVVWTRFLLSTYCIDRSDVFVQFFRLENVFFF